jgi:hypothetical protein
MILSDFDGINPWVQWVASLAQDPNYQAAFLSFAAARFPAEWERFAGRKGLAPDDPGLVVEAHIALQTAVIGGTRSALLSERACRAIDNVV